MMQDCMLRSLPAAQPEQQHGRVFKGIVVEYPSYNTYPEYKGKPYFLIKYTENGQEFIGYGTYKPEVLSEFLKEYFMPSAQAEERTEERTEMHACDCINRQAAIDAIGTWDKFGVDERCRIVRWHEGLEPYVHLRDVLTAIVNLPAAEPERKKGRWITKSTNGEMFDSCSVCGYVEWDVPTNFCPNCGADMRGEQDEQA